MKPSNQRKTRPEPIARRTRRQKEENLMKRYWEWKNQSKPSSSAQETDPPAPSSSSQSRGSSDSVKDKESRNVGERSDLLMISSGSESEEVDLGSSSDSESSEISVVRKKEKRPQLSESSDSDSEEEGSSESSGEEEEEAGMKSGSVEPRIWEDETSDSVKIESFETRGSPIVIDLDLDDEDVDGGENKDQRCDLNGREVGKSDKEKGNKQDRKRPLIDVDDDDDVLDEEDVDGGGNEDQRCDLKDIEGYGREADDDDDDVLDGGENEDQRCDLKDIEDKGREDGKRDKEKANKQDRKRPLIDVEDDEKSPRKKLFGDHKEESDVGREDDGKKSSRKKLFGDHKEESDVGREDDGNKSSRKKLFGDHKEESDVGREDDGNKSSRKKLFGDHKEESDVGREDDGKKSSRKKLFGDHKEESDVGREDKKRENRRDRKKPLTAVEIHRALFNSIMEVGNGMIEEPISSQDKSEDGEISSGEEDSGLDSDLEKPEETEVDEMYKLLDFCLACDGTDSTDAADAFVEESEALLDAGKSQAQLCEEGKHILILEEEIGIICKSCGIVREEIKHVMPSFHHNLFGDSDTRRYSMYDPRNGGDQPCIEDLNSKYQDGLEDANFDPSGTVWSIIPGLRKTLLHHQREAFEFIWRNVAGGINLDELKTKCTNDGGGCLISHAPGTGKTRLAIAFLETYMKLFKNSRPVILAPAGILLTWKKEFERWKVDIPFQSLIDEDLSKEEVAMAESLGLHTEKALNKTTKRFIKLLYWRKNESVLAISYTLFAQLAGGESGKKRGRPSKNHQNRNEIDMFREMLLDRPGLLVLDEGHMPRNERSCMFKVLSEVKTKKRFILSGTPFQNNFRELHNILCLVQPKILEKNPFTKTGVDEEDEDKIKELKMKMEPFYHCYDGRIIDEMVPGLNDNIIFLEPSQLQKKLLNDVNLEHKRSHFESNVTTALISVHPRLLQLKDRTPDFTEELKIGKWDLSDGAKARFVLRLIELSLPWKEKVLVFSEYLQPLNFVKALLESSDYFGWREGREILVMSGQQDMETRKRNMDVFNKAESEAKIMLASIKAASEGIELTGASRVVLLDVTWNPAVERQAISRAYRIGQQKVVHVYHLLMTDHDSYRHTSQTHKNKCSNYVFSSRSKKNIAPGSSKPVSEDVILEQLLNEKVVKEALQRNACEPGEQSTRLA